MHEKLVLWRHVLQRPQHQGALPTSARKEARDHPPPEVEETDSIIIVTRMMLARSNGTYWVVGRL